MGGSDSSSYSVRRGASGPLDVIGSTSRETAGGVSKGQGRDGDGEKASHRNFKDGTVSQKKNCHFFPARTKEIQILKILQGVFLKKVLRR